MMKTIIPKLLAVLMLVTGIFFTTVTASAYSDSDTEQAIESFRIEDIRLAGDKLSITITDKGTGLIHDFEISMDDLADIADEYITVPLGEITGDDSDMLRVRNPFYIHASGPVHKNDGNEPDAFGDGNPFTHDGTGTVIDNANDDDGKEFFVVETPDGNVFYLVIDRQRTAENVYLLNSVTEHDLMALAAPGDGRPVIVPEVPEQPVQEMPEMPSGAPENEPEAEGGSGNGTFIFIAIAAVAAGIAGYYFKIVRPKQNADLDDEEDDMEDDDIEDGADESGDYE